MSEIDRIIDKAIEQWRYTSFTNATPAPAIRAALLAAGYSIQLDPNSLLRKGKDSGVVPSEPPLPTLVEADEGR